MVRKWLSRSSWLRWCAAEEYAAEQGSHEQGRPAEDGGASGIEEELKVVLAMAWSCSQRKEQGGAGSGRL